jgi:hypothetical protein
MLPVVDGHILSVIVMEGCAGVEQTPGTVVTGIDSGLIVNESILHEQRVFII